MIYDSEYPTLIMPVYTEVGIFNKDKTGLDKLAGTTPKYRRYSHYLAKVNTNYEELTDEERYQRLLYRTLIHVKRADREAEEKADMFKRREELQYSVAWSYVHQLNRELKEAELKEAELKEAELREAQLNAA